MLRSIATLSAVLISFVLYLRLFIPRFRTKKERLGAVALFLVAVITPTTTAVVDLFPKAPEEQQIDQIKPMLDCTLVVDSITTNEVLYHFELLNAGRTKAKNVLTASSSPDLAAADIFRDEKSELIPNGRMLVDHSTLSGIRRKPDGIYTLKLLVTYESESSLGSRSYWSDFWYTLGDMSLTTGRHISSSPHSGNAKMLPEEVLNRIGFNSRLDSDPGTFTTRVKITGMQQPTVITRTRSRLILYDPSTRTFVFNRFSSNIVCSSSYELLDDTNQWQFVGMTWSNDYCTAFVNTNFITLPSLKAIEQLLSTTNSTARATASGQGMPPP